MNPTVQPKDETNHIFYTTWKDRGGNIGIQCTFTDCTSPTFWTGKERIGKSRKMGHDCLNCQAIVKANVVQIENDNHRKEKELQAECSHLRLSQPAPNNVVKSA